MIILEGLFWAAFLGVAYTYVGYMLVLVVLVGLKRLFGKLPTHAEYPPRALPPVTLVVAAWNERPWIARKIANSLAQQYPADKLKLLFVTDGSDDGTPRLVAEYPQVKLLHRPQRAGKSAALVRAMAHTNTPITVFTDANAMLNPQAVAQLVQHFADPKVGVVAGAKHILTTETDSTAGAGESVYWQYESKLKQLESTLNSTMGAAGELFAIRTTLFPPLPPDTLLDDLTISLRIAQKGYRIVYEPRAQASEAPSYSLQDELSRKVRIAAGGFQAIGRLRGLLWPFSNPLLHWQYVSHRVLRWAVGPVLLPLLLVSNFALAVAGSLAYQAILGLQLGFYALAAIGWLLESRRIRLKVFYVPYYFLFMNAAVLLGFQRFIRGQQTVNWTRARRADQQ